MSEPAVTGPEATVDLGPDALDDRMRSLELAQAIPNAQAGKTVLPSPLATAVSLATRSSCLAIRVGSLIGSYGFGAAQVTTLSSLELGRGILEGILSRAGKDMMARSRSDLARTDAETILERSLENLHHAMSQVVFWTNTGFQITSTTFSLFSEITQLLLSSLDQFFGSTDSSRAIASIITLIRREFQNPATGVAGQQVGVVDLVMGLCALAYLQRRCWKLEDEESRRLGHEEIVWDVVVLNDGERIDVHEDSLYGAHQGRYDMKAPGIAMSNEHDGHSDPTLMATLKHDASQQNGNAEWEQAPEMRLQNQIMQSLPADTSVSISTSTLTQKTITVDFRGPQPPALAPPPGIEVVEREVLPPATLGPAAPSPTTPDISDFPTHRVVYKVDRTTTRTATCQGHADHQQQPSERLIGSTETSDDSDISPIHSPVFSDFHTNEDVPPPLPPKRISSTDSKEASFSPPSAPPRNASSPELGRTNGRRGASSANRSSRSAHPKPNDDNAPNQKRQRTPLAPLPTKQRQDNSRPTPSVAQKFLPTKLKTEPASEGKPAPKKNSLRQALKRTPGSNLSSLWSKEATSPGNPASTGKDKKITQSVDSDKSMRPPVPAIRPAQSRATGPTFASNLRDRTGPDPPLIPRSSPSRASYISVHERRRDSIVSQTDTYSIHSVESLRPSSPLFSRRDARPPTSLGRQADKERDTPNSPTATRTRRMAPRGHAPSLSLYSIATNGSQTSLVLSSMHPKSAYTDSQAIDTLRRDGTLEGIFPPFHLLRNVTRFMLFSSASYGSNFLKVMGISKMPRLGALEETHQEIRSFAHHTQSQTDSILLASFVDPQGGSDNTGSTGTGVPLVHYISLDHESKAVVLACRGTLGFEDVLADMACDYDDLVWRGKSYKVHKGVHASARRLLYGGDGRVLYTLREALEEFTDYGLVLCGHSLGGAVTSLLGTMLAEPSPTGTGFVTSAEPHRRLLTTGEPEPTTANGAGSLAHVCLPSGRPIHVYAYGPPGTMSPTLRKATRGLITSTIQGNDLVPHLSLGVLHDFQAVALAFKSDGQDAKLEVKQRVWQAFQTGLAEKWYSSPQGRAGRESGSNGIQGDGPVGGDDTWSIAALTTLRTGMMNPKLVPPGEVFVVESSRVLRRDAFLLADEEDLGRPARRVMFKYVRDVESRFREVRFGTSMLMDHSPAKYEEALGKLRLGVAGAGAR